MNPRAHIHYWKCDRPDVALVSNRTVTMEVRQDVEKKLHPILEKHFDQRINDLQPASGQGNHLTYIATINSLPCFIRVNHGLETDTYLEVESRLLQHIRQAGVPVPEVYAYDVTRTDAPFTWQVLQQVPQKDLNHLHKQHGNLDRPLLLRQLGEHAARWQRIPTTGYGPFCIDTLRQSGRLVGYHPDYETYFFLRLDEHLHGLQQHEFVSKALVSHLKKTFDLYRPLTRLAQSCLVHKDLAFWNILGTHHQITAIIDWDDAIAGDPMDDLSLLGCFFDGKSLNAFLEGYTRLQALPPEHTSRFWLHLLRNMILKAIIRLNCGYFDDKKDLFLLDRNQSGSAFRQATHARIEEALTGLTDQLEIDSLT